MKSKKKIVLVLLAITGLLALAGCKTEVDTSSSQQSTGKVVEYPGTFKSFQEAVDKMEGNSTLKLTANVDDLTERCTIPLGKPLTLDLNGFTISGTNAGFNIETSAVFTITDSSQGQGGLSIIVVRMTFFYPIWGLSR